MLNSRTWLGTVVPAFGLLLLLRLAVLGGGLANVILVLVVWNWVPFARVVRGETRSLRSKEFV